MLTVSLVKCPKCLDEIFSRARHDYRYCSCGDDRGNPMGVSVDGGFDYFIYGWANDIKSDDIKITKLELDVSKLDLYNDWNMRTDVYGIVHDRKVFLSDYLLNIIDIFKLFLEADEDLDNRYAVTEQIYCENLYENRKR